MVVTKTMPSIHDNHLYACWIDCESRQIVLHTAFRDAEPTEYTDIIFTDVIAHRFEHALAQNILFDVVEEPLARTIEANAALFANSWRHGWPPVEYDGDLALLLHRLTAASTRAFRIEASFGMFGWVLAGDCRFVRRDARAGR